MSEKYPNCPKCDSSYVYEDGSLLICPECAHEWSKEPSGSTTGEAKISFKDVSGVELNDGDTVRVAKDLKLGNKTLKSGTKVKNIKLLDEPVNDHDISCKVDGFGSIYLKCSVVKKI